MDLSRVTFLVVDDNRHMRVLVKSILHSFGARTVYEADEGADAFATLMHAPIDVAITDWNMSPLDGIDFIRMVRTARDSPNRYLPIILLTAYTEMYRIVEARDVGVTEFLAKPISAKDLMVKLNAIVRNPRPFVKTRTYFGPDRRRKRIAIKFAERRGDQTPLTATHINLCA